MTLFAIPITSSAYDKAWAYINQYYDAALDNDYYNYWTYLNEGEILEHSVDSVVLPSWSMKTWANERGSFRLFLSESGSIRDANRERLPNDAHGKSNNLIWTGWGEKRSEDAKLTATIIPSYLYLYAYIQSLEDMFITPKSFIGVHITITVRTTTPEQPTGADTVYQLDESFKLDIYDLAEYQENAFATGITGQRTTFTPHHIIRTEGVSIDDYRQKLSFPRQVLEIDLSDVGLYQSYYIQYVVELYGATDGDMWAEGFFGDPIEGGGVVIESTDPLVTMADVPAPRLCQEPFDPARYTFSSDGTVTDRYFGLTWQRCPLGYNFDGNATQADWSDDRCTPATTVDGARVGWQAGLQAARSNTLAGLDWRLPNVKELETLVQDCADATIDSWAFPSTSPGPFWSNTPAPDPANAWQVEFLRGHIQNSGKSGLAHVRLVRDSGEAPVTPLPALRGGYAQVTEGDSGATQVDIPVYLDKPATVDVSVDYLLSGVAATEGVDFAAGSGTLTFAAGQQRQLVTVTVYGDTEVEPDERIHLALSNVSANARIAVPMGIGRIMDDEPVIQLPAGLLQQVEGDTGDNRVIDVPVTLSKPAVTTLQVDYTTEDGTALAGSDYTATSGVLVFNPGEQERFVSVPLIGDEVIEDQKRLTFR